MRGTPGNLKEWESAVQWQAMATQADVRRIALSLPETEETENHGSRP